jgi:hypothetical protein
MECTNVILYFIDRQQVKSENDFYRYSEEFCKPRGGAISLEGTTTVQKSIFR